MLVLTNKASVRGLFSKDCARTHFGKPRSKVWCVFGTDEKLAVAHTGCIFIRSMFDARLRYLLDAQPLKFQEIDDPFGRGVDNG